MWNEFLNAATYCDEAYGASLIENDDSGALEGFVCPHCGEPIYYEDWEGSSETENWMVCPICEEKWSDE